MVPTNVRINYLEFPHLLMGHNLSTLNIFSMVQCSVCSKFVYFTANNNENLAGKEKPNKGGYSCLQARGITSFEVTIFTLDSNNIKIIA